MRVTARFSNGGGDPGIPDYAREGRGLAVKFYLPDGSRTDVVALSLPCSSCGHRGLRGVHTRPQAGPETGQPDMEKVGAFLGEHPEALPAIQATLGTDPPESYATVAYNSIHAYRWLDAGGRERWVRYRFEPEAGDVTLDEQEARRRGAHYLQEEIAARDSAAFRCSW